MINLLVLNVGINEGTVEVGTTVGMVLGFRVGNLLGLIDGVSDTLGAADGANKYTVSITAGAKNGFVVTTDAKVFDKLFRIVSNAPLVTCRLK